MRYILLGLLLLDAILIIPVVLLQSGKGGGLAAMGGGAGTDTLFGNRQAATVLTKATWWLGGAFLVLALVLSVMETRTEAPESILRQAIPAGAPAPAGGAGALPGLTEPAVPAEGAQDADAGEVPATAPAEDGDAPAAPQ